MKRKAPITDALSIRELSAEDPARISAAFARMGWNKPVEQYERYLEEQREGTRDVIVAEVGDAFAGYLTIRWKTDYPFFRERGIPEVQDMNVIADFRRRGVATRLMDVAESRIAERSDIAGIGFGLSPGYNAAQRMYVLRGYVPDGRGLTYAREYVREGETVRVDDDLVMFLTKRVAPARAGERGGGLG